MVVALVTIVSEILKAFAYDVSVQHVCWINYYQLYFDGTFRGFAMANGPWESFLDGVGNGFRLC